MRREPGLNLYAVRDIYSDLRLTLVFLYQFTSTNKIFYALGTFKFSSLKIYIKDQ